MLSGNLNKYFLIIYNFELSIFIEASIINQICTQRIFIGPPPTQGPVIYLSFTAKPHPYSMTGTVEIWRIPVLDEPILDIH